MAARTVECSTRSSFCSEERESEKKIDPDDSIKSLDPGLSPAKIKYEPIGSRKFLGQTKTNKISYLAQVLIKKDKLYFIGGYKMIGLTFVASSWCLVK